MWRWLEIVNDNMGDDAPVSRPPVVWWLAWVEPNLKAHFLTFHDKVDEE